MSVTSYKEGLGHVGHKIVCVTYGDKDNVSYECEDCNEVILSFDKPEKRTRPAKDNKPCPTPGCGCQLTVSQVHGSHDEEQVTCPYCGLVAINGSIVVPGREDK